MRSFYFIILSLLVCVNLRAQNELEINYIAHDHYNGPLLDLVDDIFQSKAYDTNRHTYIYLANANEPKVLLCNLDKYKELEEFKYTLNGQITHNVWPEVDIMKLLELLKEDDFVDDWGNSRYNFFTLNFYVTPSFITYGYAETLIARLFWDLDLSTSSNFVVNLYLPDDVDTNYDMEKIFGAMKLLGDYQMYIYTFNAN